MARILFVLTSHDRMLNGDPTGLWLEEFAVPYLAFTRAGHEATVASVSGGAVPVDPNSKPSAEEAEAWAEPIALLADTPAFDTIDPAGYDALFLPGGHGTVFDMPDNAALHDLILRMDGEGRIVAAVCHAPAVFAGLHRADGTPFVAGRKVAAFTDAEEHAAHGVEKVPFLLETKLKELGAVHVPAEPWTSNAVRDGRLVTGQNPQSSAAAAALVLELL